ncbi:hypothetical protein MMC19_002291 [Ptychographa xylographoides]|nr:hypothetical protein [Ptychographa xylographoides]
MGKHPRSSSSSTTSISTATPSPQLLQKIRTLTGNHGCRDSEADRACTSPVSSVGETTKRKKEKRKNSLVDWEWEEWESEVAARKAGVIETTTGLLDSGFEIGERIGEKIPGYRVSAGECRVHVWVESLASRFLVLPGGVEMEWNDRRGVRYRNI